MRQIAHFTEEELEELLAARKLFIDTYVSLQYSSLFLFFSHLRHLEKLDFSSVMASWSEQLSF